MCVYYWCLLTLSLCLQKYGCWGCPCKCLSYKHEDWSLTQNPFFKDQIWWLCTCPWAGRQRQEDAWDSLASKYSLSEPWADERLSQKKKKKVDSSWGVASKIDLWPSHVCTYVYICTYIHMCTHMNMYLHTPISYPTKMHAVIVHSSGSQVS